MVAASSRGVTHRGRRDADLFPTWCGGRPPIIARHERVVLAGVAAACGFRNELRSTSAGCWLTILPHGRRTRRVAALAHEQIPHVPAPDPRRDLRWLPGMHRPSLIARGTTADVRLGSFVFSSSFAVGILRRYRCRMGILMLARSPNRPDRPAPDDASRTAGHLHQRVGAVYFALTAPCAVRTAR